MTTLTQATPPSDFESIPGRTTLGQWLVLTAALLGWMFDGFEMGLFPLVARPALKSLLEVGTEDIVGRWFAVITAGFLVGAATGGVLFGWLGDRVGRVRAMTLSVLTYAIFSGLCGLAQSAWQVAACRFIAALGMGGEWSLGVALVMEIWPNRSRALMAGLIGAAANVGYLLVAALNLAIAPVLESFGRGLSATGLPESWVSALVGDSGWRLLMLLGATPAVLTFFIRLFVPESESWEKEQQRGATSHWAARDLWGVLLGALGPVLIIYLWAADFDVQWRVAGTIVGLAIAVTGYTWPVIGYLHRAQVSQQRTGDIAPMLRRMWLGACLSGVALLGTWGSVQWIPVWADELGSSQVPHAKAYAQIASSLGAVVGCVLGALIAGRLGRRVTYSLLCAVSLLATWFLFQRQSVYGAQFLVAVFLVGFTTGSFYGWLPFYLPELFPTRMRATGQGFSFNFGRILASIGTLQTANLMGMFENSYPRACSMMSLVYFVGLAIIWLAPETRGKPLPE